MRRPWLALLLLAALCLAARIELAAAQAPTTAADLSSIGAGSSDGAAVNGVEDPFAADGLAPSPSTVLYDVTIPPAQLNMPFPSPATSYEPAPAPTPSPPPPPPPSPSPPPAPPSGTRVNLVLRLAGAPSPMPADMTTRVAATLSALSPGYTWTFFEQQPLYPGQVPKKPEMLKEPVARSTAPAEGEVKVTVDPLPINGLGRKLRQETAPQLGMSAKGQCYSTKHALAPDEATCTTWCEAWLVVGKLNASEYDPRFYEKNDVTCCACNKKKDKTNSTDSAVAAATPAPGPSMAATITTEPSTTTATSSPSPSPPSVSPILTNTSMEDDKKIATKVDEGSDGIYLFASTVVVTSAAEAALNNTMREAAAAGRLLESLKVTAGVSATSADIVFLGSGEFNFTLPAPKYVRPAYGAAPAAPTPSPPPVSSSGSNNGMLIGITLGSAAAVVILVTVATVFAVRRKRQGKGTLDGQALACKWESERRLAEEESRRQQEERRAASQAASNRYWARLHSQTVRSQKIGRLRSALGLGPKDHLGAAAARMEAAEAAAAATGAAAKAPPPAAESSSKSVGRKPATSAPSRTQTTTITLDAHSLNESEAPLATVAVRPQPSWQQPGGSAGSRTATVPSWATRDPGTEPKPSMFGKWFGRG